MFFVLDRENLFSLGFNGSEVRGIEDLTQGLSESITSSFPLVDLGDNSYVAYFGTSDSDADITIFCPYRKKKFLIDSSLLQSMGTDTLMNQLYHCRDKRNTTPRDALFYGDIELLDFEEIAVSQHRDLLPHLFIPITTELETLGMREHISLFSYDLVHHAHPVNVGTGLAETAALAHAKSVSEAIERIVQLDPPTDSQQPLHIDHTLSQLRSNYSSVELSEKPLYSSQIEDLYTGDKLLVPDDLLYYSYSLNGLDMKNTSSGAAAHVDIEQATMTGLHELIERDAVLSARLLRSGVTKLPQDSFSETIKEHVATITSAYAISVDFFSVSLNNPLPVIICLLTKGKQSYVASSAGTTYADAIEGAFLEAVKGVASFDLDVTHTLYQSGSMSHSAYYLDKSNFGKIQWLKDLPEKQIDMTKTHTLSVDDLVAHYHQLGVTFYRYQYHHPIADAHHRVVVKLLSDGLVPLWHGEAPKHVLENRTLRELQAALGVHELNDAMHPFS